MSIGRRITKIKIVIYMCIFLSLSYLFYNQSINLLSEYYISDLSIHINFALTGQSMYSFIYFIFKILWPLGGGYSIAIFLSLVVCLTIGMTEKLLCYLAGNVKSEIAFLSAVIINFVGIIYIPWITQNLYIIGMVGNLWHNSTYLCMRLTSLIVIFLFLKIYKCYLENINKKGLCIFSLLLTITNFIKSNFFLMFAPVMLILLLTDFFRNPRKNLYNVLMFGISVLPSVVVLIIQYFILFDSSSGNGISVGIMTIFKIYKQNPILSMLCGLLYPLIVLLYYRIDFGHNQDYKIISSFSVFGILEFFMLAESGERVIDANFAWGSNFSVFLLFLIGTALVMKNWSNKKADILFLFILMLHFITGVVYFINILVGNSYMM